MVIPTPPTMWSLELNTSSMALGQLCNTGERFLSASSKPLQNVTYGTCGRRHEENVDSSKPLLL